MIRTTTKPTREGEPPKSFDALQTKISQISFRIHPTRAEVPHEEPGDVNHTVAPKLDSSIARTTCTPMPTTSEASRDFSVMVIK